MRRSSRVKWWYSTVQYLLSLSLSLSLSVSHGMCLQYDKLFLSLSVSLSLCLSLYCISPFYLFSPLLKLQSLDSFKRPRWSIGLQHQPFHFIHRFLLTRLHLNVLGLGKYLFTFNPPFFTHFLLLHLSSLPHPPDSRTMPTIASGRRAQQAPPTSTTPSANPSALHPSSEDYSSNLAS